MSPSVAPRPGPDGAVGVFAHTGLTTPETWWHLTPASVLALTLSAVAVVALAAAAQRAGHRSPRDRSHLRGLAVALGAASLALLSPLHGLADSLFSAHMVQHLVLVAVVAPLLARGVPAPTHVRGGGGGAAPWALPLSTAALVVVFAGWHVPALYEPAVRHPLLHAAEHLTIVVTATAHWATVSIAARQRVLAAVGAIAVSGLAGVALGALLALAPEAWYGVHAAGASAWGLDPLTDQQLGGMIMWVPAGAANLAAAVLVVFGFLRRHDEAGGPPPVPARPLPLGADPTRSAGSPPVRP